MQTEVNLEEVTLSSGGHNKDDGAFCVMELVSYMAREPWSDHPKCACPVLTAFCLNLNDSLPGEPRQRLKPFIPRLIGSRSTAEVETRRATLAMDWIVRTYTPAWLELNESLKADAAALRALPEIVDTPTLLAAQPALDEARKHAAAAWAAAWAAARAAAWDAAGDAARDAARAAAWDAAGDAAWDAAGDAAWAAARAAAWDAAGDAARDAAGKRLDPVVIVLRDSAFDLLDRMLAVRE